MILYPMLASFALMAVALPFVYRPMPMFDLGALAVVSVLVLIAMSCMIAAYRRGERRLWLPRCNIPRSSGPRFGACPVRRGIRTR